MRRVEHCLVRKKPALGIFLDIVGAFDNVIFRSFVAALQELGMSKILTSWIENLLRHRTVQVELYGDKVKREVVKGNPQGGILSPFLRNCVLQPVARVTQQGLFCSSLCQRSSSIGHWC